MLTCTSGKKEDEDLRLWFLEIIDHVSPISYVRSTIESKERVLSKVHKVFEDVYHLGHLAEYQDLVSIFLLFLQDAVQLTQFRRVGDKVAEVDDLDVSERPAGMNNARERLPSLEVMLELACVFAF